MKKIAVVGSGISALFAAYFLSKKYEVTVFEQQNYLWGMVGGKYLPSVLYKFRLLVIQENTPTEAVSEITEINENIT